MTICYYSGLNDSGLPYLMSADSLSEARKAIDDTCQQDSSGAYLSLNNAHSVFTGGFESTTLQESGGEKFDENEARKIFAWLTKIPGPEGREERAALLFKQGVTEENFARRLCNILCENRAVAENVARDIASRCWKQYDHQASPDQRLCFQPAAGGLRLMRGVVVGVTHEK